MKSYLIIFIVILMSYQVIAQDKITETTQKFFRHPELDKFTGTWVFEKNGQYFSIILTKYVNSPIESITSEQIGGTHISKQNGKEIDKKLDTDVNSIKIGNPVRSKENMITFRFREYRRPVMSTGTMEYADGPTPMLKWKLNKNEFRKGILLSGEENYKDPEFIVPTDITLYKVK